MFTNITIVDTETSHQTSCRFVFSARKPIYTCWISMKTPRNQSNRCQHRFGDHCLAAICKDAADGRHQPVWVKHCPVGTVA
jgi:hypothetical protein